MLGSWVRAPNGSQVLKIIASLAQLVEHDTLNVGVQGSSPWGGTKGEDCINLRLFCIPWLGYDCSICIVGYPIFLIIGISLGFQKNLGVTWESDGIVEDCVWRSEIWLWKHGGMPALVSAESFACCWIFNGI